MGGNGYGIAKISWAVPIRLARIAHGAYDDDGLLGRNGHVHQVGRFFKRVGTMGDDDAIDVTSIDIGSCHGCDLQHQIGSNVRSWIGSEFMNDAFSNSIDPRKFAQDLTSGEAWYDTAKVLIQRRGDRTACENDGYTSFHGTAKIDRRGSQFVFLLSMITGPHHLEHVATYKPGASVEEIQREYGLQNVEKLASNENPYGPSRKALEHVATMLSNGHRYGDGGYILRDALSSFHNVPFEATTVNNGSDALIHQIMRTFLLPGTTALSCRGGFVSFGIAVRTVGAEPQYVPLTSDHRFDVEALADAITDTTRIIYIPNPNNPTGTHVTREELTWLLDRVGDDRLVVLDEAYHQYAMHEAPDTYPDGIAMDHPNILSLRTFSKAYGLAAFRIGYAVGHPDVVKWLHKTKLPFDPNAIGCAAALGALEDVEHVRRTVRTNHDGLRLLEGTLRDNGYSTSHSVANFVMVDLGDDASAWQFHHALLEKGFISRPLRGFDLPTCVRITTGTPEQNERLQIALTALADQFVTM
jgi:histidinol-phosphate aminotransferase